MSHYKREVFAIKSRGYLLQVLPVRVPDCNRNVKFFLSMLVERDREKRTLYLSQQTYLTKILRRFSMENCKGCPTPLDPKTKLHRRTEAEESTNMRAYQEAVGSLTYAAITT